MLTDQQVTVLWNGLDPTWKAAWRKRCLDLVTWARTAPDGELRTPEAQQRLWSAKDIASAGQGEHVPVTPLLADAEVVNAIVSLRTHTWPADATGRAAAIQAEFERILALTVERGKLKVRPNAKLHRLFGMLLPDELTWVLNYNANRRVADLMLGDKRDPRLRGQVKIRARLRSVLGKEKDLAESVGRSGFSWWLYQHYDLLASGKMPPWEQEKGESEGGIGDSTIGLGDQTLPPLVLWPFGKQFMGNFAVRNYAGAYRSVVQAALPGLSQDDLVGALQSSGGFDQAAAQSLRLLIVRVRGLGFLEDREGRLYPSAQGDELLEGEQSDILVERLCERIFGFAQLLRYVADHAGASDADTVSALQGIYPNWTSPRVPTDLRNWSSYLGLIQRAPGGSWSLTEYGAAWAGRLPALLPMPPRDEIPDDDLFPAIAPLPAIPYPSFDAILERFRADPEIAGFVFDDHQLAVLHAAWRCHPRKRFIILSGLSGTGKTAVTLCYSRAVCELMGIPVEDHREIVPVSPDWRDPSGLLGYFNALHADPTFQAEPALRLVLRASADPGCPYFLILDEMNLARVERYFAPFLSAMETGKDLVLHANAAAVNEVPPRVPWPANLHIAGTVNMDETTHPFSDKVLDRAFTLEFWDVDLKSFFERTAASASGARLSEVEQTLAELHDAMRPIRRHFGYRTAGEVLAFMETTGGTTPAAFLDHAVFSKVLPRLRGEDTPAFRTALEALKAVCKRRRLPVSERKIDAMLDALKHTGVTRFWA